MTGTLQTETSLASPLNQSGAVRLPDFVMLGQGKAGTSLIFRELQRRSDVGLSRQKELHHFKPNGALDDAEYVAQFAHVPQDVSVVGEIAPDYLSVQSIDMILERLGPQTKLIVSLRHPIDQAYSRYIQNIAAGNENAPFKLTPQVLARRLTALIEVLQYLFARVPAEQVLMLQYEKDIATPRPPYRRKLADFLGIPMRRPPKDMRGTKVNAGVMPRFLWSGDEALELVQAEGLYRIPRRTLVFCAQSRNSKFWRKPTRLEVCDALARQSRWTPILEEAHYDELKQGAVLGAADRLETEFDMQMDHWRVPAKRIQYGFAPPPARFLKGDLSDADPADPDTDETGSGVPA